MRIVEDLIAFSNGNKGKMIMTVVANPCFHAVLLYRISSFFHKLHLNFIGKVFWYINRVLYSCDIDFRADLAGGLVIKHGLGVVVGQYVVSKGRLTVYQGVTLGGSGDKRTIRGKVVEQPIIGRDVIIYTDAKVFGPVIIGHGNHIKAGAIITEDMRNRT